MAHEPFCEPLAALGRLHERGQVLDLADGRQTTLEHRALERATLRSANELATVRGEGVDDALVSAEVELLAVSVAERGGWLAGEQERAVRAACADHRLVVVVGQAGTGKSTALRGVARAHQQAGRTVLVTSTGAQAAERLASELREAGVEGRGYSTAALRVNVERGAVVVEREAWQQAARAVEAYRISYQIEPAEPTALGPEPDRRDSRWRQHVDWAHAGEHVLDAREQLDIDRSGHGPTEERMARVPGLMPEQDRGHALDHDLGREP